MAPVSRIGEIVAATITGLGSNTLYGVIAQQAHAQDLDVTAFADAGA